MLLFYRNLKLMTWLAALCLGYSYAHAQNGTVANRYIDSLIETVPPLMRSNIAAAEINVAQIIKHSAEANYRHGIIEGCFDQNWLLYRKGDLVGCIRGLDSALTHIAGLQNSRDEIKFHILKGQCFVKQARFDVAVEQFTKAQNLSKKFKDEGSRAGALMSIGWAYMESGKPNQAISFFNEVLKVPAVNKYLNIATVQCNIASCYNQLGRYKQAVPYARQGIATARATGSLVDVANGLNILARATYQLGDTKQAATYLTEASQAREKVNDPSMLASDYMELADLYLNSGQAMQAITYAQKAVSISEKHNIALKLTAAYETLAKSFEANRDYQSALVYYKKVLLSKDSLSSSAYSQSLAQLQEKYNAQKRDAENLELRQENLKASLILSKRQKLLGFVTAVAAIFALAALFLFVLLRNRHKARLAVERLSAQQKRALAILETEESERRRIAADLHDGVCQTLAAASMQLKNPDDSKQALARAEELLEQAAAEVRAVSHQMTPELLKQLGLFEAIAYSVNRLNAANSGMRFAFFSTGENYPVDEMLQVMLFRSFQELVNNIIKHAQATEVNINLNISADDLTLMVEDNGIGFEADKLTKGLGLASLKNRVNVFNGILTVDSATGHGSTIIINFEAAALNTQT